MLEEAGGSLRWIGVAAVAIGLGVTFKLRADKTRERTRAGEEAVKALKRDGKVTVKHLTLVLNPAVPTATVVMQTEIVPLLILAGVKYNITEAKEAREAIGFAASLSKSSTDGVLAFGDDVLTHELVQGLLAPREPSQRAPPLSAIPLVGHHSALSVNSHNLFVADGGLDPGIRVLLDVLSGRTSTVDVGVITFDDHSCPTSHRSHRNVIFSAVGVRWGLESSIIDLASTMDWAGRWRRPLAKFFFHYVAKPRVYRARIITNPRMDLDEAPTSGASASSTTSSGPGANRPKSGLGPTFVMSSFACLNLPWVGLRQCAFPQGSASDGLLDVSFWPETDARSTLRRAANQPSVLAVQPGAARVDSHAAIDQLHFDPLGGVHTPLDIDGRLFSCGPFSLTIRPKALTVFGLGEAGRA